MEKFTPSKTKDYGIPPCGKTDCDRCLDRAESEAPAEKVVDAANIFRLYYETLLQGFSMDFRQAYSNHGNFHCT